MSADTTNVPYNPYYDLETGVQQHCRFCSPVLISSENGAALWHVQTSAVYHPHGTIYGTQYSIRYRSDLVSVL